jgi:Xaa-Pro dipeptidase
MLFLPSWQAPKVKQHIFERLGSSLRLGLPVFEIQAQLEQLGHRLGCEHCDTWLTVLPVADRCRYVTSENTNVPRDGDQVLLGIMLMFQGHWGHAIRTGSMGEPGSAARKAFDIVSAMHQEMLVKLRPGVDLRLVGEAGIFNDGGLGRYFQFRSGHALGHSYEDPIGSAEFPQPYDPPKSSLTGHHIAEPGMLFEIHPNLFIEGFAGASIGDMVLVTGDGAEVLTKYPRGLLLF